MATLQDVAKRAGVSLGTASTALNGRTSVRAATRELVEQAAMELGYQKNAAAAVLAGKQRRVHSPLKQLSLGHLESPSATDAEASWTVFAREAKALGYDPERIRLQEFRSPRRALDHLRFLNVQGLYLSSPGAIPGREWLDFDWNRFSVVKGFRAWPELTVPLIRHNAFDYMGMTRDQVLARGYRRIAALLTHSTVPYDDQARLGALLGYQRMHPEAGIEIDWWPLEDSQPESLTRKAVRWLRKQAPEVVLAFPGTLIFPLRDAGFRIPEDFAFAAVIQSESMARQAGTAGCERRSDAFPLRAVQMLHRMVQVGDRGQHELPVESTVEPLWLEGTSLPVIGSALPAGCGP